MIVLRLFQGLFKLLLPLLRGGYQRGFLYIGYLMPFYLSPMLFYGTHRSYSLYCVTLTLSWWIIGPMPKATHAFLLMCCAPLLKVSDPQRLASAFFSVDVLEALLMLVLSAADRNVRFHLAPWLAHRCQNDRVRLRWLFPAVCLGAFLLATRLPATVVAVLLFAFIEPGLHYLEEAPQRSPLGDPALFTADEAERVMLMLQRQGLLGSLPRSQPPSSSVPSTPHILADHPLNWFSPQGQPPAKTMADAMAAVAAARMPSSAAAPIPTASASKKTSTVSGDARAREPSLCSNLNEQGGTAHSSTGSQASGTSSSPMATPRFCIASTESAASVRSHRDLHGSVADGSTDGSSDDDRDGAATGVTCRVIIIGTVTQPVPTTSRESSASRITGGSPRCKSGKGQGANIPSKLASSTGLVPLADGSARVSSGDSHRSRTRSAHDVGFHKTSASPGPISDVDEQTFEVEERHRKYAEIRTAFLVGPVIMAVVGNVFSLWTLPSRVALPLAETAHADHDDGALGLWLWALLTLPGVFGVALFVCGYFYVANLQHHEAIKYSPSDQAISQAAQSKRTSPPPPPPPPPRRSRYLFLVYLITSGVILMGAVNIGAHPTQVWILAALVVVAAGSSLWLGDHRAFQRHNLVSGIPWNVLCVFGGAQLITHFTVEGRLVEGFFELVSPSFWRGNSRFANQLLLTAVACVLAEVVGVTQLCRLLQPVLVTIASESRTRLLYYLLPVSVALSSNMLGPVSLPIVMLHEARSVSLQQLVFVGVAGKSILLAMVLLSVNTAGSYFFQWGDARFLTKHHNHSVIFGPHVPHT